MKKYEIEFEADPQALRGGEVNYLTAEQEEELRSAIEEQRRLYFRIQELENDKDWIIANWKHNAINGDLKR